MIALLLCAAALFTMMSCAAQKDKNKNIIDKTNVPKSESIQSNPENKDGGKEEAGTDNSQENTASETKNTVKKEPLDGIYKSYLWYADDEDMCFEFKNGTLTAFVESDPSVRENVDFTVENNIIKLTKDGQTLVHAGEFLYYNFKGSYYEADLGDKKTFDLNLIAATNDYVNFRKDGTCDVGVISPGGNYEKYGTGKYERKGNVITFTFGNTYPYNVAKKFYYYYNPDEGRIYFYTFKKK